MSRETSVVQPFVNLLTFELMAFHGDLADVCCGAYVILPDFSVDAQVSNVKGQEGQLPLLYGLLQN